MVEPESHSIVASDMTLALLLNSERFSRLVQQKSLDQNQLGASEVLNGLMKQVFEGKPKNEYHNEIQQTVKSNLLKHLMNLSVAKGGYTQVRALAMSSLNEIKSVLSSVPQKGVNKVYNDYYLKQIEDFLVKPETFKTIPSPKIPDGSPIGSFRCGF